MDDCQKVQSRLAYLKAERSGYFSHWKEISDKILPRSGKFFGSTAVSQGQKKYNNIYDPTGTEAARILAAGMMSGNTSPARPWVRLGVDDPELNDYEPVKVWCSDVTKLMLKVFQKSNTYRALHSMYEEQGIFAVASCIILPDYNDVIRLYPMTIGEYYLATDSRGEVDTIYREMQMTVAQVVQEFGIDNCSNTVKSLYNSQKLDQWVPIIHAIEPRTDVDPSKIDALNMPFKSVYMEQGQTKYLRESGFESFPGLTPRWSTLALEAYGNNCPGMEALGAINQLQHQALRKAEVIDYQTKPPLFMPSSMMNRDGSLLPGGVTYIDGPADSVRTAYEVNLDLNHLLADTQDVRRIVRSAFSSDLFLMLSNGDNPRMTATEVAERREEKMTMLGPVIERQQNELLSPLINKTFDIMVKAGIVPPAPPELQGRDIQVEFISVLAQAQKAIGTNSVDRFINSLAGVASIKPEVLDKFDQDEWVDSYTDSLGTDPKLVVPTDKVIEIRKARAAQQAQQEQMNQLQQGADTANKLAAAKTGDDSALTSIMRGLQGYN
jgi:hypothetical protein